jgi:MFS transporter, MHS family, alpha-ketoglutarate permease
MGQDGATPELQADPRSVRRPILAIVGASSGNLVEWFDFYTYSFTALYLAPTFFPAGIEPASS